MPEFCWPEPAHKAVEKSGSNEQYAGRAQGAWVAPSSLCGFFEKGSASAALYLPFKLRRIALAGAVALTAIFKFQGSAALEQSPARQILNHNLRKENHAIFGHSVSPEQAHPPMEHDLSYLSARGVIPLVHFFRFPGILHKCRSLPYGAHDSRDSLRKV